MKKFKIIFTDSKTGYDLYVNFILEATCMSYVAVELERRGAHFRLIEDVTAHYSTSFIPNTWDKIPLRAFDNYR